MFWSVHEKWMLSDFTPTARKTDYSSPDSCLNMFCAKCFMLISARLVHRGGRVRLDVSSTASLFISHCRCTDSFQTEARFVSTKAKRWKNRGGDSSLNQLRPELRSDWLASLVDTFEAMSLTRVEQTVRGCCCHFHSGMVLMSLR